MTHTSSFSSFYNGYSYASRRCRRALKNFSIEAVDYDGESYSYDVEAYDANEAEQLATEHFASLLIDVYHMNIYNY